MKIFKLFMASAFLAFSTSCGDDLADLNIDPNTSPTARPTEVLTSGIGYYGIVLDDNFNEQCALMAQYWAGGPGVAILDHERYFFEPGDFNNEWGRTYQQSLSDLSFVIKNGNAAQSGVAQLLTANIYQILVDMYGDVPYSEALKGAIDDGAIVTPKYDTGKSIYDNLIVKIDEAITKLNSGTTVGAEDLIYGGDLAQWKKFANSLKLKIYMRQSVTDASVGAKVKELVAGGNFISDAGDIAKIPFSGGAANNWNPMYAAAKAGIGLFYVASTSLTNKMAALGDPRTTVLFSPAGNGNIVGLDQGNINDLISPKPSDFSYPAKIQFDEANDVILMSPWEVMFLRAEAAIRFGTADDQKQMYESAVKSHFAYIGATGADEYLAKEGVAYDASFDTKTKISQLAIQKWISLCGLQETEGWIETRRFDTPDNKLFTDPGNGLFRTPTRTVLGQNVFPSIRLYPQTELSFNTNSPKSRKITDKVFWDN